MSSNKRYPGPVTPDMTPTSRGGHNKVLVLRHLEPEGAILGVPDFHRRMPGLSVDEIKQALRELVAEGMVAIRFESTAAGKRFYMPK